MRYRDLKDQRDDAIRRAVEAERLSRKEEVDRLRALLDAEAAESGRLAAALYQRQELFLEALGQLLETKRQLTVLTRYMQGPLRDPRGAE